MERRSDRSPRQAVEEFLHPSLLGIYLDDHRAGAALGLALARRVEQEYAGEDGFEQLAPLRREIEADVATLDELRDRLDIHGGRLKRVAAVVGERVGRLKLNGRLVERSPLSKVLELEMLIAGVAAKGRLWDALMVACGAEQLADVDLRRLRERADEQVTALEALHKLAAAAIDCQTGNGSAGGHPAP